MKSKPMGKWDVCFLVGAYTAGLTWKDWATYNDLGGLCHVIMSGFDGWFTEHPALTVTAGERRDWTLWVSAGKNAQSVNCAALCMNIGQ